MVKQWLIALLRKWPYWVILILWELLKDWLCQIARDFLTARWGSMTGFLTIIQQYNWMPIPVVGICLLIWTWYKTNRQNKNVVIPQLKSDIRVKEEISGNCAILVVNNIGADANFTAEAVVVKGVPPKTRYTMCWNSPPHLEHPIKRGGTSTITVAEVGSEGGLLLHKWGISGLEKVVATTQELRDTVRLNMRYPTMARPIDDSCTIQVTIIGTPTLLTLFDDRKYIVKIDHEQGHKLIFTRLPESNPDREGSLSK